MAHIRLSPSASVTPTEMGVLLRSDLGEFRLDGPDVQLFVGEMLPLLDGTRDREAVADALEEYSRQSILAFLDLLERHGLLETVPETSAGPWQGRWDGQREFFRKWTDRPEEATRRLSDARVLIVGLEPWGAVLAAELAAAGVGTLQLLDTGEVGRDDLLAVRAWGSEHLGRPRGQALAEVLSEAAPWCRVTTSPLALTDDRRLHLGGVDWDLVTGTVAADDLMLLQSLAYSAHEAGVVSLYAHLEGLDAILGPVVVPGQTACWNCYRLRRLANSDHPQAAHAVQRSLFSERPVRRTRTYLGPMAPLLGHLLGLEAIKLVSRYTPSTLVGRLLVQNLITLETTVHTVVRMPWCEVCGGSGGGGPSLGGPVVGDQNERGRGKGGARRLDAARDPGELREMLAGWVDDRVGIIRHLMLGVPDATEPELPLTGSAVLASYTEGTYHPGHSELGSGKGLSPTEAMIGAVGEAIERYSAARYRKSHMLRSSMNDLQVDFLDPRRLCLYEEAQYEEPGFPFARFDPDQPIEWTKGRWLDTGDPVWLPALPTYFNFRVRPEEQFCQVTSNGLAAGTNVEDASLRAVFELVERDAFMISWLCQRPGRKLVLDETLEPGVREVVRQLRERGAEVELYLLDVGIHIPTVVCLGLGGGKRWPGVTVALGAHADLHTAIRKAVLEQGHVGPYVRRLMLAGEHPIPARPEEVGTLTDHALYYAPAERGRALDFLRFGNGDPILLDEWDEPRQVSLGSCVERLAADNVRVAIADVTSPDVASSPFRVVRALGTDVQQIHFGFKLRRLANPRLKARLANGLNPHPHPLA